MRFPNFLLLLLITITSCSNSEENPTPEEQPTSLTAPLDLSADNTTSTGTQLRWSAPAPATDIQAYRVYQDGNEIAQVPQENHTVTNLEPETTYAFTVSAVDGSGDESPQSDAVSVTTLVEQSTVMPKVLVFTKTAGFDHNTREESVALVQQLATEQGFEVVVDNEGTEFDSAANLSEYQIVFFTNTSGNTLTQDQRDNVESYAAQGGHFISNHAASDGYGHSTATTVNGNGKGVWDWYAENVTGCSVRNGPNHTAANFPATVTVQNANGNLTEGIGFPWSDEEEWYYWEGGYINPQFEELLRVAETGTRSFDVERMTAHYWERPDGGTSFYTSMGHARSKYMDPEFVQLLKNVFSVLLTDN